MRKPCTGITRRSLFPAAAALPLSSLPPFADAPGQGARVSIARCPDYGAALTPALRAMFDQLGGLGGLVRNKTVAIKVNLTGSPDSRLGNTPAEYAQYTHPAVIGATVRLIGEAGARRIRVLEGAFSTDDPLEEFMLQVGWDPLHILNAAANVEMINTNIRGRFKQYARFNTPHGGHLFPGFDINASYEECDVLVSLAKLKEHGTCGVTLSMKNMFGATPLTIYGDNAGKDEPDEKGARGGRGIIMHAGRRQPSRSAPQPKQGAGAENDRWRMPRIVADLTAARPIHLSIVDGIFTMSGGEGPWNYGRLKAIRPGLLLAGLNPVSTDAVATACMGFDPLARRGTPPFETRDNCLLLAAELGAGTPDLKRIEVAGLSMPDAVFPFRD
ncbi:MAG: DUF362 domain-containing protein [Acidobacteria bacterium]|nr:DUF362 domain-containing protein [Acidobacteriota bacterium]